jgi:hypothetical protein
MSHYLFYVLLLLNDIVPVPAVNVVTLSEPTVAVVPVNPPPATNRNNQLLMVVHFLLVLFKAVSVSLEAL